MRNDQWIFYEKFSVSDRIENLWKAKIASETITSNSGKLNWWIHGLLRTQNANLNLTPVIGMTTEFIFQINNQFIDGILGGTLDLTCVKSTTANGLTFRRPFRIINSLRGSWGLRLTGLDCKDSKLWLLAPHSLGSSYESLMLFLSVMTSFCYYNQHPLGFCFFVQMKAFVSKPLLGLPNINKKGKTNLKWLLILVVVEKWRHRAVMAFSNNKRYN